MAIKRAFISFDFENDEALETFIPQLFEIRGYLFNQDPNIASPEFMAIQIIKRKA